MGDYDRGRLGRTYSDMGDCDRGLKVTTIT